MRPSRILVGAVLLCLGLVQTAVAPTARAQGSAEEVEKELNRYRGMMSDPFANPGYLAVDRGEALWSEARGTRNVSLEACDLGMGPGVLEGAYARLPRYFADAGKVMDLEQRLLFCMRTQQGLDTADVIKRRFGSVGVASDMEDLVTFIGNKSTGMKVQPTLDTPQEREMYAVGEAMFYRRSATMDFACSTCHGGDNQRIRLQGLQNFSTPNQTARDSAGSWPAYRATQGQVRTMQHRLWDCFRQMRMPAPEYASDGVTALTMFLAKQGEGGELNVPAIKR